VGYLGAYRAGWWRLAPDTGFFEGVGHNGQEESETQEEEKKEEKAR